jgi:hypothetical protein
MFHGNLLPPIMREHKSLEMGGKKLVLKILYSNSVLFVHRLGRAQWQIRTVMHWRGYVQRLNRNGAFRDSAH